MYNINNFTAVCAKYVHFTLHLLCCLLVHPDKFLILCKWLLRYYYWTYYSNMRHGDRPHNYVSNYIFGFAISSGLTKILPIEKCIIFFETPCTTQNNVTRAINVMNDLKIALTVLKNVIAFERCFCVAISVAPDRFPSGDVCLGGINLRYKVCCSWSWN